METGGAGNKIKGGPIILGSDLFNRSKEELIDAITHELAQCFLEHEYYGDHHEALKESEILADKTVIEWDFEKELRVTPTS